jgi:hypothetical protein
MPTTPLHEIQVSEEVFDFARAIKPSGDNLHSAGVALPEHKGVEVKSIEQRNKFQYRLKTNSSYIFEVARVDFFSSDDLKTVGRAYPPLMHEADKGS